MNKANSKSIGIDSMDERFIKQYSRRNPIKNAIYKIWWQSSVSQWLKMRRLRAVDQLFDGALLAQPHALNVLEVGCGTGKDFIRLLSNTNHNLYGIDIFDTGLAQDNFKLIITDTETIPFPNGYFDIVVSFGVLEHLEPIDKLDRTIKEIRRVAKKYCIVVPSISTLVEPHMWSPVWQLRHHKLPRNLNYFSDETWTKFSGFHDAKTKRTYYLPLLISNLYIYG